MFDNTADEAEGPGERSTTWAVLGRSVTVTRVGAGRWSVAVERRELDGTFSSDAEAWLAGVREVNRLRDASS